MKGQVVMQEAGKWSRERALGNRPEVLGGSRVVVVGAGALGGNLAMNLALLGVRHIDIIDFDVVEPHNPTRSPLLSRALSAEGDGAPKAKVVAENFLRMSEHERPRARYAPFPFEALGLGALRGASVIASCVDRYDVRTRLGRMSRLLGIPLIDAGLFGTSGNVSTFPNQSDDEPCPQCPFGPPAGGGISCTLYAREAIAQGFVPASQSIASVVAGIQSEHVARALHGEFPLGGKILDIDIRTGLSRLARMGRSRGCRAAHRRARRVLEVDLGPTATVRDLLATLGRETGGERTIMLNSGVIWSAPCAECGRTAEIALPDWAPRTLPRCHGGCASGRTVTPGEVLYVSALHQGLPAGVLNAPLSRLAVAPGDTLALDVADDTRNAGAPDAIVLSGDAEGQFIEARICIGRG